MMDTEAFREFKTGLTLLRDNYANKALPHMRRAVDLEKNNPYYMSYLGVVLARSEQKWGEAEKLCDSAVRMKRNQAQLYLNLAEICATRRAADHRYEQAYAAQLPYPGLPGAKASAEPAAGNIETPCTEDFRAGVLNPSLHPQTRERASRTPGTPVLVLNR